MIMVLTDSSHQVWQYLFPKSALFSPWTGSCPWCTHSVIRFYCHIYIFHCCLIIQRPYISSVCAVRILVRIPGIPTNTLTILTLPTYSSDHFYYKRQTTVILDPQCREVTEFFPYLQEFFVVNLLCYQSTASNSIKPHLIHRCYLKTWILIKKSKKLKTFFLLILKNFKVFQFLIWISNIKYE